MLKRKPYTIHLDRGVMIDVRKYCLDKGIKLSDLLEDVIKKKITPENVVKL